MYRKTWRSFLYFKININIMFYLKFMDNWAPLLACIIYIYFFKSNVMSLWLQFLLEIARLLKQIKAYPLHSSTSWFQLFIDFEYFNLICIQMEYLSIIYLFYLNVKLNIQWSFNIMVINIWSVTFYKFSLHIYIFCVVV